MLCLAVCMLLSITCGTVSVSYRHVLEAVKGVGLEDYHTNIVYVRIPRMIFGVIAGSALSISGAMMQAVTRNPIADPAILGVNTGAALMGAPVFLWIIRRGRVLSL